MFYFFAMLTYFSSQNWLAVSTQFCRLIESEKSECHRCWNRTQTSAIRTGSNWSKYHWYKNEYNKSRYYKSYGKDSNELMTTYGLSFN